METSTQQLAFELEGIQARARELRGGVDNLKQQSGLIMEQEKANLLISVGPVIDSVQTAQVFLLEMSQNPFQVLAGTTGAQESTVSVRNHVSNLCERLNGLQAVATAKLNAAEAFRNEWMERGAEAIRLRDQTNQLLKTGEENINGVLRLLEEKQNSLRHIIDSIAAKEGELAHKRYLADRAKKDRNAALITGGILSILLPVAGAIVAGGASAIIALDQDAEYRNTCSDVRRLRVEQQGLQSESETISKLRDSLNTSLDEARALQVQFENLDREIGEMTATVDSEADTYRHINASVSRFLGWVGELQAGVEVMELFGPSVQRLGQTIHRIVESTGGEWPVGDPQRLLTMLASS
ncbi:hypothetical protein MFIFM68171_06544 [Madurella fahalii]|uniref:Uncharacterized protein n=1 Tax=Madurella fahalii TaxID=1157608 RepID=A0ABQ0GF81_9PEZI